MSNSNLGAELQQLSHLLEVMIIKQNDVAQARLLSDIHQDVLAEIRSLVNANINTATPQYVSATASVKAANDEILDAIKDLKKVADSIKTVAKVVEVLRKLAEVVI